jgi:hypothetical protein
MTETDQVSETSCFLIFLNTGRWKKSKNLVILYFIHHRQNPLERTWGNIYIVIQTGWREVLFPRTTAYANLLSVPKWFQLHNCQTMTDDKLGWTGNVITQWRKKMERCCHFHIYGTGGCTKLRVTFSNSRMSSYFPLNIHDLNRSYLGIPYKTSHLQGSHYRVFKAIKMNSL